MTIDTFFPTSLKQREKASSAPIQFAFGEFIRAAVGMAIVQAVFYVFIPITRSTSSGERLYFVTAWAAVMTVGRLWAARRNQQ
jgi:hypothetical protein